ncbi:MAG TPA: carbohydrate kinase family protein [Candidatus Limnocylindrales bacterium]|nr:carbohydrate kinase family protein [Candidatus Limnocylindrales bacterium]
MIGPVVVLGDVNVDLSLALPDRDVPKAQRRLSEPQMTGGGTGGNAAAALAALGTLVEFHGTIGDDGFGRWVTQDFQQAGVGTHGLIVLPEVYTPEVIALVEPDGERYLVIWPMAGGAHTHMRPEHLDADLICGASWLHTTGMCLRASPISETVLAGMAMARAAHVPTSIDLNLRIELWGLNDEVRVTIERALVLADVVFGSGPEELMPLARAATVEQAAQHLSGGVRTIVARLGAAGALATTPDGQILHAPGFPAAVVSTLGAGDAFDGGFITARVEGKTLAEALRWGNAVAALKIARPGGARDLPTSDEVEALLHNH